MKLDRRDGSAGREALIAMIVSTPVLATVAGQWETKEGLFGSRHENLIGGWAVAHYNKYRRAPGPHVQQYFDLWAARPSSDKDTVKLVEEFLTGLSGQYAAKRKAINSEYAIDLAAQHFTSVRLRRLADQITADVQAGDVAKADSRVHAFPRIELGTGAGIRLLSRSASGVVQAAFEQLEQATMVKFGQEALDAFFEDNFSREMFIAFMAKEKGKKSFWEQELVWQSIRNQRNVAFFEVGDQSLHQLVRRIGARAAGRPFKADLHVKVPLGISKESEHGMPFVDYAEEQAHERPMSYQEAVAKLIEVGDEVGENLLQISVHPNSSISVSGIERILDGWERSQKWRPDVIVIDYADILAPLDGSADTRDQINATWKAMRRLSQQRHALVVTATQADAGSYDTKLLSRKNFSEDKRKYGHVTGMIGINQTKEEEEAQQFRLNWVIPPRDCNFTETICVHTAGCLALANPAVVSTF